MYTIQQFFVAFDIENIQHACSIIFVIDESLREEVQYLAIKNIEMRKIIAAQSIQLENLKHQVRLLKGVRVEKMH